jgi:hypothetical protein
MDKKTLVSLLEDSSRATESLQGDEAKPFLESSDPIARVRSHTEEWFEWLLKGSQKLTGFNVRKLLHAQVWLIPDPRPQSRAVGKVDSADIIVSSGMAQLLAFRANFTLFLRRVAMLLRAPAANAFRSDLQRGVMDAIGMANALTALKLRDPVELCDFRPVLSYDDMRDLNRVLVAAELFLVLHENAHVALGQTKGNLSPDVPGPELWVHEENSPLKAIELAADDYALDKLPDTARPLAVFGATFFLEIGLCHEMWATRLTSTHPLALNRMYRILSRPDVASHQRGVGYDLEFLDGARSIFEQGLLFVANREERLTAMLRGANATYAKDFIDWFMEHVLSIEARVAAAKSN